MVGYVQAKLFPVTELSDDFNGFSETSCPEALNDIEMNPTVYSGLQWDCQLKIS